MTAPGKGLTVCRHLAFSRIRMPDRASIPFENAQRRLALRKPTPTTLSSPWSHATRSTFWARPWKGLLFALRSTLRRAPSSPGPTTDSAGVGGGLVSVAVGSEPRQGSFAGLRRRSSRRRPIDSSAPSKARRTRMSGPTETRPQWDEHSCSSQLASFSSFWVRR